jgi:hypothetical protein
MILSVAIEDFIRAIVLRMIRLYAAKAIAKREIWRLKDEEIGRNYAYSAYTICISNGSRRR